MRHRLPSTVNIPRQNIHPEFSPSGECFLMKCFHPAGEYSFWTGILQSCSAVLLLPKTGITALPFGVLVRHFVHCLPDQSISFIFQVFRHTHATRFVEDWLLPILRRVYVCMVLHASTSYVAISWMPSHVNPVESMLSCGEFVLRKVCYPLSGWLK